MMAKAETATNKLYELDSELYNFEACVIACEPAGEGRFAVELDQTAFFPEGGGQYADRGTLNGAVVYDVQINDERILHFTDTPFAVGLTVTGALDADERFARMQNHTGEHILCGIAHAKWGAENVGFHLGECEMTMDLDIPLTEEQLTELELAGNRAFDAFVGIEPDVYSQSMEHVSKKFFEDVATRKAKGLKTTFYVCNSPLSPNTFVFSSPDEGYWLGLYPAVAGLDGLLRWAYNSWPPKPIENADYAGLFAGDTFLVYPDGSPSIRLLMLQNGLEAAEKYKLLRAEGKCDDELDKVAKLFDAKKALWKKAPYFTEIREESDKVLNKTAD